MRQLPLDLVLPERLGRDDFLRADANAQALDQIDGWPDWPDRLCLLVGPEGSGKSHLAAIWAERAGALRLGPGDLAQERWPDRMRVPVLVDDADRTGQPDATLFHLLNLARERGLDLLLTASAPPEHWGLHTPDLLSRLRAAARLQLGEPDDDLLRAVLVKLCADRQLLVDESVVAYLTLRLGRSLAHARAAVAALDRTALARNRRITRPMAGEVLRALDLDPEGG